MRTAGCARRVGGAARRSHEVEQEQGEDHDRDAIGVRAFPDQNKAAKTCTMSCRPPSKYPPVPKGDYKLDFSVPKVSTDIDRSLGN